MEQFDKYRNELLSDDYLTERINKISQGEFVSPSDCIQLTELYLARHDGCKLTKTGESYGELTLSPIVVTNLEQFLRRPGNEGGAADVRTILTQRAPVKVVFDGNTAEKLRDYQFLSPTGAWPRFLVHELQSQGIIRKNFSFKIPAGDVLDKGRYLVYLFELKSNGIRYRDQLLGIPVDLETNVHPTQISIAFLEDYPSLKKYGLFQNPRK